MGLSIRVQPSLIWSRLKEAQTPQWVGSEAASITQQGNQYIFLLSSGQNGSIPKVTRYMQEQGINSVVIIYVNNEFGQGGRAAAVENFEALGVEVLLELSTEQQQADFTAEVLQAMMMNTDAIFAYTNEEESARLLMALKQQDTSIPVFGEAVLLSQTVLDLAGDAANGVAGHVNLTAEAPVPAVQDFRAAFEEKYGYTPDHNGMKGYIAMFVAKEMAERVGSFDRMAVAEQLHCALITTEDEPGVLMDIAYDENGDIDRDTFLISIEDGKQVVTGVLPRLKNTCADQ
ncbi:MAG: ABC transporter substrate-binding protein [Deinococcales bacterium]